MLYKENLFALCIAILGCNIKKSDLNDFEEIGMRRYPKGADDAFRCYEGKPYTYDSHFPSYYDIEDRYHYKTHPTKLKVV